MPQALLGQWSCASIGVRPNGSRLSCGRPARQLQALGRQQHEVLWDEHGPRHRICCPLVEIIAAWPRLSNDASIDQLKKDGFLHPRPGVVALSSLWTHRAGFPKLLNDILSGF